MHWFREKCELQKIQKEESLILTSSHTNGKKQCIAGFGADNFAQIANVNAQITLDADVCTTNATRAVALKKIRLTHVNPL